MNYILGTLALLGVGLIGLLIEIHKQDQWTITSLGETIEQLAARNVELMGNQKPIPWNKGKKGYKLNRKPKETTFVLNTENPVIAAWDAEGRMTKAPEWMEEGHRSAGAL